MAVDILYLSHNRLRFTQASFAALIANTNWDLVRTLFVMDDDSIDGTREWLYREAITEVPATVATSQVAFGGPVAAMNHYLDIANPGRADIFAKIDNDVVVSPGWLDVMLEAMNNDPKVDCLGMEPGFATVCPDEFCFSALRRCKPARHIGGVGLIKTRIFGRRKRPAMHERWFGWTQFQQRNAQCAWIDPDLPVFLLDHLNVEPWRTLTERYVVEGWAREWGHVYDDATMQRYAGWWLERVAA